MNSMLGCGLIAVLTKTLSIPRRFSYLIRFKQPPDSASRYKYPMLPEPRLDKIPTVRNHVQHGVEHALDR